jgi:hypothetical protein
VRFRPSGTRLRPFGNAGSISITTSKSTLTTKAFHIASFFEEQLGLTASSGLSFEERFGIVVERELAWRDTRRLERLLKGVKLKSPEARVEDIEHRQSRGIDQRMIATLADRDWADVMIYTDESL